MQDDQGQHNRNNKEKSEEYSETSKSYSREETLEAWPTFTQEEKLDVFRNLNKADLEDLFIDLDTVSQAEIYGTINLENRRNCIRILDADDVTDLIQELPDELKQDAFNLLDNYSRAEVKALLAYEEDEAGGLMNPRFTRLRPDFTVDQAIKYLYAQSQGKTETIYYGYVCDKNQILMGVVSLRQLFSSAPSMLISDLMIKDLVTISAEEAQEEVARLFSTHNFLAIPVIDQAGVMQGIVTFDDIVSVVQEEATEDIQKIGGTEALDAPYLQTDFLEMIKKRAGWLLVLFMGEMFTATAMQNYGDDIAKAVVLALFIPLVISSGGNAGSQATTLIIRSLALGEIRLQDWFKVFLRELGSGACLGAILGLIGLFRILVWPNHSTIYGPHYVLIAIVVAISLIGVVLWGTLAGSMLPFILRYLKLDPATASAPFVATVVDVTGLVIYFSVAKFFLSGILL